MTWAPGSYVWPPGTFPWNPARAIFSVLDSLPAAMGLDRIVVDIGGADAARGALVVLLHGFGGRVDDLAPFARALGVPARFVVPHGLVELAPMRGRAWWPIDVAERDRAIAE